jgi:autotransporter-associated beta strand protein
MRESTPIFRTCIVSNGIRATIVAAVVLAVAPALAQVTSLNEANYWLEAKAQQLIRQSRTTMNNGTSAFIPQAGGGYGAFWLRDYAYMLEACPEAFTPQEMKNSLLTFVGGLSASGAGVDNVGFNGVPSYLPGGSSTQPVADGSQFTVDVAYLTYQQTHDTALLQQVIGKLVQTMNAVPMDPNGNGLVYLNSPWNRCPWGFTDTVQETGDTLMCSLLYIQSCNQLASLLGTLGQSSSAAAWQAAAAKTTASVQSVFWNSSTGLFNAATGQCNQPDIMGSAFAVQTGVATSSQSMAIANYFDANYNSIVAAGQVRNLPGGTYWQNTSTGIDWYQNGGYWGVATGWFASTLSLVDSAKANQMLLDAVNNYKTSGVNEWVNAAGTPKGVGNYCASVMPLIQLKQLSPLPGASTGSPVLVQLGNSLTAATDLALQSSGGTAFAANCISGFTQHTIAHLNDGNYGNSYSWIGSTTSNFCGIAFQQASTISSLAFGRDNAANDNGGGPYNDRYTGMYVLQYTRTPTPNASTPDSAWTSFGSLALDTNATAWGDGSGTYLRHLYQFSPISGVTGVRILLDTAGGAIDIDELEVYGASPQWTGGGTTKWSNSSNWTTGTPVTGSLLTFAGSAGLSSVNDLNSFTATALSFSASAAAFTLSGNSLTLAGNIVNSSTASQTVGLNMALTNPTSIFAAAAGNLTINGALGGSGGLLAVGPGTVTLAGANLYTGTTTVTGGTLNVTGTFSASSGLVMADVGTLILNNNQTTSALNGTGGVIQLNNGVTFTINGNGTGYAAITGSGNLTQATGVEFLYGTLSYSGSTNIAGGILVLAGANTVLPSGSLLNIANGAQLDLANGVAGKTDAIGGLTGAGNIYSYQAANTLDINVPQGQNYVYAGSLVQYNNSSSNISVIKEGLGSQTLGGSIQGAGTITVNAGKLTLSAVNTYTGGTTVTGGTLTIGAGGQLGSNSYGGAISIGSGAMLDYANPSGGQTLWGSITGGGTLQKDAGGDLILSGSNSVSTLTVNAGRVFLFSNQTIGAIGVAGGAMLDFGVAGSQSPANTMTFASGANLTNRGGTLTLSTANVTLPSTGSMIFNYDDGVTYGIVVSGSYALAGPLSIQVGGGNAIAGAVTLAGPITGAGSLTMNGPGKLVLSGTNTYSGGTSVAGGVLAIKAANNLGVGNLTLGAGTLQTTGSYALDADTITLTAAKAAIDVSTKSDTLTLAGLVTGNGGLMLTGPGALALTGTAGNSYAGDTSVLGGTLLVQADNALPPNSNLVIGDGASAVLDFGAGGSSDSLPTATLAESVPHAAALAPAAPASVPEPSALALLAAATGAGLLAWRKSCFRRFCHSHAK